MDEKKADLDVDPALTAVANASLRLVLEAVAGALEADPHQFSTRPCATCRAVSGMLGRDFGCVARARSRARP